MNVSLCRVLVFMLLVLHTNSSCWCKNKQKEKFNFKRTITISAKQLATNMNQLNISIQLIIIQYLNLYEDFDSLRFFEEIYQQLLSIERSDDFSMKLWKNPPFPPLSNCENENFMNIINTRWPYGSMVLQNSPQLQLQILRSFDYRFRRWYNESFQKQGIVDLRGNIYQVSSDTKPFQLPVRILLIYYDGHTDLIIPTYYKWEIRYSVSNIKDIGCVYTHTDLNGNEYTIELLMDQIEWYQYLPDGYSIRCQYVGPLPIRSKYVEVYYNSNYNWPPNYETRLNSTDKVDYPSEQIFDAFERCGYRELPLGYLKTVILEYNTSRIDNDSYLACRGTTLKK